MKEHGNSYLNVVAARRAKEQSWTRKKLNILLRELDIFFGVPQLRLVLKNGRVLCCFQTYANRLFVERYRSGNISRIYYGMGFNMAKPRLENLGYATNLFHIQNLEYLEIFPKKTEVK